MKQRRPFSGRRFLWRLICLALAVILGGMLAITGIFYRFLTQITDDSDAPFLTNGFTVEEMKAFADPRDVN